MSNATNDQTEAIRAAGLAFMLAPASDLPAAAETIRAALRKVTVRADRAAIGGIVIGGLAIAPNGQKAGPWSVRLGDLAPVLTSDPGKVAAVDPAVTAALSLASLRVAGMAILASLTSDDQRVTASDLLALALVNGPAASDLQAILTSATRAIRATSPKASGTSGTSGTKQVIVRTAPTVGAIFGHDYQGASHKVRYDGPKQWVTVNDGKVHTSPTAAVKAQTGQRSVNGAKALGL